MKTFVLLTENVTRIHFIVIAHTRAEAIKTIKNWLFFNEIPINEKLYRSNLYSAESIKRMKFYNEIYYVYDDNGENEMEVKSGMSLDKFRKMVWPKMLHELSFYNIDIPYGNFNQPIIIKAEEF